ncbi:MAG: hypothetical protein ACYC3F_14065 [Gemmatimonadaceae bacterium]
MSVAGLASDARTNPATRRSGSSVVVAMNRVVQRLQRYAAALRCRIR